jgi:RNA polymerase sigma-70 factor (ECF subfamily)
MVCDDTTTTGGTAVALREPADTDRGRTADEAFAALTRRHLDGAFRLAWAILGGTQEAEDAVQDAFAMAWRKRASLREPDRFDAWFGKILVNVCRERLRGMARSRVREIQVAPPVDDEPAHERAAPADPDIGMRLTVGGALAGLDADHRIVVVLRYWADLTVDEIADRVGVPPGTVKSRLHYALRALAPSLEDVR